MPYSVIQIVTPMGPVAYNVEEPPANLNQRITDVFAGRKQHLHFINMDNGAHYHIGLVMLSNALIAIKEEKTVAEQMVKSSMPGNVTSIADALSKA